MISTADIEKVSAATDLVALAKPYCRDLRRTGKTYVARCLWHKERSASLCFDPTKGLFICRGCGVSGNAIQFLQRVESVAFPEAVRMLAARAGVELSNEEPAKNSYAAMISAEAIWAFNRTLRAYRDREMQYWQFAEQVYCDTDSYDEGIAAWARINQMRCRRKALRWHRIATRFELLPIKTVVEKYYRFRAKNPGVVLQYREEVALAAACGAVEKQFSPAVADLWPESFEELIQLIGERL